MDIPREPERVIDVEGDDLETVARKLGVGSTLEAEKIVLTEENLRYLNDERYKDGETLLMRFTRLGKEDIVDFLLKCEGIRVNERNREYDTAADIALSERKFDCLLKLLQGEAEFPYIRDMSELQHKGVVEFVEQRQKFHRDIESGDLKSVEKYTKQYKSSMFLCVKFQDYAITNRSALFWAAKCNQLEIYAYLLNHGAKFKDYDEEKKCRFDEKQRKELNGLVEEYFVKVDNSHVLKLMQSSHSPQGFNDSRKSKIRDIYEHLNNSEFVSLIMKVLEYEDVDVVFDFENEHTNNVYCLNNSKIYGLTVPSKQRIFVGAKKCESAETVSVDVAGTLAHELCHMAMLVLYRNEAKPYEEGENDTYVFEVYEGIVTSVRTHCNDKKEEVERVLKMVYSYNRRDWHSELISRVPHILAMYGDKKGKSLLQEQAKGLYEFFLGHVVPKCKEHIDSSFYKKDLCMIESLHKHHGCVKVEEKRISPVKEPAKSFEDYLIPKGNISVIVSSNTRLCSLHVYHQLKRCHSCHMDKQCLFFNLGCFKSNWPKIMDAFESKACKYMVLVTNEKMLKFEDVSKDFDDVKGCGDVKNEGFCEEGKKVILIVGEKCEGLRVHGGKMVLDYKWSDLSHQYKRYLIRQNYGLLVNFKGKEMKLTRWIDENKLAEIIEPEDVQRLTNNELIQLGDGKQMNARERNTECYVRRKFVKRTVRKSVFEEPRDSNALFVTGLRKEDLERICIDQRRVQWMEESTEEIETGKRIFIGEIGEELFGKLSNGILGVDSVVWLKYSKDEFHPRFSKGSTKAVKKHIKEYFFTERQLIEASKDRVVLISDDPGMGKSTVLTELMRIMKEEHPDWWVGRIDLNDHADDKVNPLSLDNIEEDSKPDDVLEMFIRMLGMRTSLEVYLFEQFVRPRGLKREYKIFFDAFDEVCPSYKVKALKLFRCIIEETTMQLWITTRRHEKVCLETEFDTFSHSLKEFTVDDQVKYLDSLWKQRLKSLDFHSSEKVCLSAIEMIGGRITDILEEKIDLDWVIFQSLKDLKDMLEKNDPKTSCYEKLADLRTGIEGLDFTRMASVLVDEAAIVEGENRFLGIPLHLFMLGNVAYDNHLRLAAYSNVHTLFSEFVEGKIRIYWKEKMDSKYNEKNRKKLDRERIAINGIHKTVARCVMDHDSYPWDSITDRDDVELNATVGILTKLGDQFQFVHLAFAEFFFSEWLLEMIERGELEEEMLRKIMQENKHSVVRRFLDGAFQKGVTFNVALIQKWDLAVIFNICIERANRGDFTGKWVLGAMFSELEKKTLADVISKLLYVHGCTNIYVFKLLNSCLSDAMLFQLFFEDIQPKLQYVFDFIACSPADEVSEMLEVYKRAIRVKLPHSRKENTSEANSQENEADGDGSEAVREENCLFDARGRSGCNALHYAARNRRENVFAKVVALAREFLGENRLASYLLERDELGRTVLHVSDENNGTDSILMVISEVESILDSSSFVEMLRAKDNLGCNFPMHAANCCPRDVYDSLLARVGKTEGSNLLRDVLFEADCLGHNVLLFAAMNEDIGTLDSALENLRAVSKSEEEFARFVSRCDRSGNGISHYRAYFSRPLSDLSLLESHVGRDGVRKLLAKTNHRWETCLHELFRNPHSVGVVMSDLSFVKESFDADSLEKLILKTDLEGNTIMHMCAKNRYLRHKYEDILRELRGFLSESSFYTLIMERNRLGEIVRIAKCGRSIELESNKWESGVGGRSEVGREGGRDRSLTGMAKSETKTNCVVS